MKTVIPSWQTYIPEIYRVTAQGGTIQLTESSSTLLSQSSNLPSDSAIRIMERAIHRYSVYTHHNLNISTSLSELVKAAGFHSIEEKTFDVPCGSWSSGTSLPRLMG
jgi:hypothetical protein